MVKVTRCAYRLFTAPEYPKINSDIHLHRKEGTHTRGTANALHKWCRQFRPGLRGDTYWICSFLNLHNASVRGRRSFLCRRLRINFCGADAHVSLGRFIFICVNVARSNVCLRWVFYVHVKVEKTKLCMSDVVGASSLRLCAQYVLCT